MDTLHLAVNVVGLCAASLGLARVKLSASAVLIHHFGSHHQGLDNPVANDIAAEIVGITSFSSSAKAYADAHSQHHRFDTFATLADPDAQLMWSLGLRPGRAYGRLKRLFWWALVSPRLHGPMSWARLKHTFGPDQPRWRRITAFTLWGGLGLAAWAGGWLSGLLGGLVLPLLVFGNVSSFVELASEHKFLLRQPLGGKARQLALSHGRNLLDWWPDSGAPWWRWAWVPVALPLAVVARLSVLPGDLSGHEHHHLQTPRHAHLGRYGWTNAALEYTPNLDSEPALAAQRYGSVWAAIKAWLLALSHEPA